MSNSVTINGIKQTDAVVSITTGSAPPTPPSGWLTSIDGVASVALPAAGATVDLRVWGGTPVNATGQWIVNGTDIPGGTTYPFLYPVPANTSSSALPYAFTCRVTDPASSASSVFGPVNATVAAGGLWPGLMIPMTYATPEYYYTNMYGGVAFGQVVAFSFTPTKVGGLPVPPEIRGTHDSGGMCDLSWCLSEVPGEIGAGLAHIDHTTSILCQFSVDGSTGGTLPLLHVGRRYFMNVVMNSAGVTDPNFFVNMLPH